MTRISSLNGLGIKSERLLAQLGIRTERELRQLGAIEAYRRVRDHAQQVIANGDVGLTDQARQDTPISMVSINLLYAMVGGLSGRAWQDVAKHEKYELLMQLAAADEEQWHQLESAHHE